MTDIQERWGYACSGDIASLKQYYDEGGRTNRRYFKFNDEHSLIMGAFRSNQFDTVEYLVSIGECITTYMKIAAEPKEGPE